MSGIRMSKKYGLNPTIPLCIYCGKPKNEIAVLGKIGKRGEDLEAPKYSVVDNLPCTECKAKWDAGVTLLEAVEENSSVPHVPYPFRKGLYPTGRYAVMAPVT